MKTFFAVVMTLGFIAMVGTAGSSDLETIGLIPMALQMCLGLILMMIGFFGIREIEDELD